MREVLLFCAAAGRGTPLRRCHRQRIVCGADHDLRYFAISSPVRPIDLAAL